MNINIVIKLIMVSGVYSHGERNGSKFIKIFNRQIDYDVEKFMLKSCYSFNNIIQPLRFNDTTRTIIMPYYPYTLLNIIKKTVDVRMFKYYDGCQLKLQYIKYIAIQLLNALHAIHSRGIIHCDIKPQNIMCDEKLKIYIIDFNLSKIIYPEQIYTNVCCTDNYRAPEIYYDKTPRFSHFSNTIDIWSFGCIVWYMATGNQLIFDDQLFAKLEHSREEYYYHLLLVQFSTKHLSIFTLIYDSLGYFTRPTAKDLLDKYFTTSSMHYIAYEVVLKELLVQYTPKTFTTIYQQMIFLYGEIPIKYWPQLQKQYNGKYGTNVYNGHILLLNYAYQYIYKDGEDRFYKSLEFVRYMLYPNIYEYDNLLLF